MFKNLLFPTSVSQGMVSGPRFNTDVVVMDGGAEQRNQNWSEPLREYDAAKACKDESQRLDLISFFRVVRGMAYSFKFKDHSDYTVATGEGLLTTLTASTYQLYRRYTRDGETVDADVTLPESGSIVVKQGSTTLVEAAHYSIDYATGILTIIGSPTPAPSAWTGRFYVRCRFATDRIALVAESLEVFRSQSIPLIETRIESS